MCISAISLDVKKFPIVVIPGSHGDVEKPGILRRREEPGSAFRETGVVILKGESKKKGKFIKKLISPFIDMGTPLMRCT